MRKYIIGALFGAMLATAFSAHAEVVSLVNQVVQGMFPVSIDGKPLGNAIVVDNKTYLPVRDFGEAVGYKVSFTDDQQVILTKNAAAQTTPTATTDVQTLVKTYNDIGVQLDKLVIDKQSLEKQINDLDIKKLNGGKIDDTQVSDLKKQVEEKQAQIDKLMTDRKNLEIQMQSQP